MFRSDISLKEIIANCMSACKMMNRRPLKFFECPLLKTTTKRVIFTFVFFYEECGTDEQNLSSRGLQDAAVRL